KNEITTRSVQEMVRIGSSSPTLLDTQNSERSSRRPFTPRSITNLEPRIRGLRGELLTPLLDGSEMDLATGFAIPLPMMVIAEMLGIPTQDRSQFQHWNDVLLRMSYVVAGQPAQGVVEEFMSATREMAVYIVGLVDKTTDSQGRYETA